MASKKKASARKKSHLKRGKPSAKQARPKRKAPGKKRATDPRPIYVTYNQYANSVEVDPNDLPIQKRETVITWIKFAGSDPITFKLNPNTQQCPFGTPTLDRTHTKITVRYHGTGDSDKDWKYEAQVTASGEVEISSGGPMLGGSTIKNH